MRFLVDMNLATEVAAWLRSQGHEAVHLRELGLQELGDAAVLAKAMAEKRVVWMAKVRGWLKRRIVRPSTT